MHQSTTQKYLAKASGLLMAAIASCGFATAQTAGNYLPTNIISDGFVPATVMDANFINPWGVSGGRTLWINTTNTGLSYVTSIAGAIAFKAVIPPASGTGKGLPTGTIQNTTTAGFVLSNGTKASFLFATLDGTISGWNPAQSAGGNNALIAINNSANNAVYTDMALVTSTTGTFVLVPNFGQGGDVEIYDTTFKPAKLAGSFTDPNVPAGYAPYAIKSLGTQVFVTYMLRTVPPAAGAYQPILGTNTGFVSVFDVNGNFVARAVTGGNLNAPWGVAIAPTGFGIYAGDLLIGNFGDGLITAYNPTTYAYLGMVGDVTGKPIAYPGLWEIFATTATGDPTAIYFTAGIGGETHGLFGEISNGPTTSAPATFNLSTSSKVASVVAGSSTSVIVSLAPTNAFTGNVTMSCSGLPVGAACSFPNMVVGVLPTAPALTTVTIQTSNATTAYGKLRFERLGRRDALGVVSALLLPFGSLLAFGRRRRFAGLRLLGVVAVLFASAGLIVGCSNTPMIPVTPAGTSNVTISAVSGSVTQSTVISLTVH